MKRPSAGLPASHLRRRGRLGPACAPPGPGPLRGRRGRGVASVLPAPFAPREAPAPLRDTRLVRRALRRPEAEGTHGLPVEGSRSTDGRAVAPGLRAALPGTRGRPSAAAPPTPRPWAGTGCRASTVCQRRGLDARAASTAARSDTFSRRREPPMGCAVRDGGRGVRSRVLQS